LIVGTEKGNIKVYNYPLLNRAFEEFNAHYGEVTSIVVSPDAKYIISGGNDGSIFIYGVSEYSSETEIFKPTALEEKKMEAKDFKNLIVDDALADVVLIKR
jgi:WD40 repeat protein